MNDKDMVTEAVLAACDQNHLSKPKSLECRDTSAMVPCSGEQISNIRNTSVYIALYVATLFVNKYVLSVLNFTYPTIFQGWQSLVGAILLRMLIGTGKINVEIAQISRSRVTPWLPAMMMHVLSIYSGSIALSKISVPVFICLQNLTLVLTGVAEIIVHKRFYLDIKVLLLFVLLSSSLFISITDPQFDFHAYCWMAGHIISSGSINIYYYIQRSILQLTELERVYLNYIYSFAVLLPCTYFLGDAIQAQHFQFWYYYKFYISCVLSGVFGVLLIISQNYIQHTSPSPQKTSLSDINALAKIVAAGISILVFAFTPTALNIPWIFVNLCTGMLLKQSEFELPNDPSLTSEERMEESNV